MSVPGAIKCNRPSLIFRSVFQYPVTHNYVHTYNVIMNCLSDVGTLSSLPACLHPFEHYTKELGRESQLTIESSDE